MLVTVSDKKKYNANGYYEADVVSAQDYYPFGMMMPGRNLNAGGYRYGFNGKENDNEIKGAGNQQDYGFRIYDPRVGRFLSVDPITKQYPELTPYQFASNRPIDGVDKDGLEWEAKLFWDIFIQPFFDFNNGVQKYAEGSVQKVAAQTGNASYQNKNVTLNVQERLARKDILEGTSKQLRGGTEMAVATADVVSTYVPLATEITLAAKSSRAAVTTGKWVLRHTPEEAPKAVNYLNWGSETIGDGIRMTEQAFNAAKGVTNLIPEGKLANHLFKGAGKLADNPANRTLIQKIANGKPFGVDAYGKSWYMGVDGAGKSVYTYTQNGVVKGAGYATMTPAEMIAKYGLK